MEINELELFAVEIDRSEAGPPCHSVLVRITTDSGLEGWGEAALPWPVAELAGRRERLLPVLAGRRIFDMEDLPLQEALRDSRLRAAVETALWDLVGRSTRQPLYHLFGGGYRRKIPLAVQLQAADPRQAPQLARELAELGFHTQVVLSSGDPAGDLGVLATLREAMGDGLQLQFDARRSMDLETARDFCAELEYESLDCLIDPLQSGGLFALASLGRQTMVPLATRRDISNSTDVLVAVRCGAAPSVVLDLEQLGGIGATRKAAAVAEAGSLRTMLASSPSVGIKTAAMLQLAASTAALSHANQCCYHQLQRHVLKEPLEVSDGMMSVPEGPGLGVQPDRAKIEQYQVA